MWTGDDLVPLGICEDFNEAADKAEQKPRNHVWIFRRDDLEMLRDQINEELEVGAGNTATEGHNALGNRLPATGAAKTGRRMLSNHETQTKPAGGQSLLTDVLGAVPPAPGSSEA